MADPELIAQWERTADGFAREGFFLKAVAMLKQVLHVEPERPDVHFKLADLYAQLGLVAEAVGALELGFEEPRRQRDPALALAAARRLAALEPARPLFRLLVAQALVAGDRRQDALAELAQAGAALRAAHPELAVLAEDVAVSAHGAPRQEACEAVRTLRVELYRRSPVEFA